MFELFLWNRSRWNGVARSVAMTDDIVSDAVVVRDCTVKRWFGCGTTCRCPARVDASQRTAPTKRTSANTSAASADWNAARMRWISGRDVLESTRISCATST